MKVSKLSEVIYNFYYAGRPKSTGKTLDKTDMLEMTVMAYAGILKTRFQQYKSATGNEDYSIVSPLLSEREITLADGRYDNIKRADMPNMELFRLPFNAHIRGVSPVSEGCADSPPIDNITQVDPAEEYFYRNDTAFSFFVIKGTGIDIYNLPFCVKKVIVEAMYADGDSDLSPDIAFEVGNTVLGISLKVKGFPVKVIDNSYDPNVTELQKLVKEADSL